jgi:hypothetical protein
MSDTRKSSDHPLRREPGDLVQVLVALDREPDDELLARLRESVDLSVRRVIGDKLVATIEARRLDELRALPGVREVEVATTLRSHRR